MTTEIATTGKDQFRALIEKNRDFLAKAAPKHVSPERLMNMALTAYSNVQGLRECWTPSVIGGVIQASIVGLELNTPLGQAYLIPFNDRKTGKKIAQFIIGYKGLIKLMQNSGALKSIHADVVHANDLFEYEYGTDQKLRHKPASGGRGEVTHFYCYVMLKDGGFQMEVMTKSQVDSIMAKSPTKGEFGPWKDHPVEMGIKTAIRRIAKYVPLSAEVAGAIEADSMGDAGMQDLTNIGGVTIDHEPINDGGQDAGNTEPERPAASAAPAQEAEKPKPGPKRRGTARVVTDTPAEPGDGGGLPLGEPDGTGPGAGSAEPVPAPGSAPAPAGGFDGWLQRLSAAKPGDIDALQDEIKTMKPAVQDIARRELAAKERSFGGELE